MPLRYTFKSSFQKTFDKLPYSKQILATKALEALQTYFEAGEASYGLRIKKLHDGLTAKTFEARISLDLRIVWVQSKEEIIFALLGNHDDVLRFIKNL